MKGVGERGGGGGWEVNINFAIPTCTALRLRSKKTYKECKGP